MDETGLAFAVRVLSDLRDAAIAELRSAKAKDDALQKKREIDRALAVLSQAVRLGLNGGEEGWLMPECRAATPSSEFRVIDDNETERREHWTEVVIDGKRLRLLPGDVVLRRR